MKEGRESQKEKAWKMTWRLGLQGYVGFRADSPSGI